jgi:hypothetical protein
MNITVDLTVELLQETLIALRDRKYTLRAERNATNEPVVREIAQRQLSRVVGAIAGIEDALEFATGKRA